MRFEQFEIMFSYMFRFSTTKGQIHGNEHNFSTRFNDDHIIRRPANLYLKIKQITEFNKQEIIFKCKPKLALLFLQPSEQSIL